MTILLRPPWRRHRQLRCRGAPVAPAHRVRHRRVGRRSLATIGLTVWGLSLGPAAAAPVVGGAKTSQRRKGLRVRRGERITNALTWALARMGGVLWQHHVGQAQRRNMRLVAFRASPPMAARLTVRRCFRHKGSRAEVEVGAVLHEDGQLRLEGITISRYQKRRERPSETLHPLPPLPGAVLSVYWTEGSGGNPTAGGGAPTCAGFQWYRDGDSPQPLKCEDVPMLSQELSHRLGCAVGARDIKLIMAALEQDRRLQMPW